MSQNGRIESECVRVEDGTTIAQFGRQLGPEQHGRKGAVRHRSNKSGEPILRKYRIHIHDAHNGARRTKADRLLETGGRVT